MSVAGEVVNVIGRPWQIESLGAALLVSVTVGVGLTVTPILGVASLGHPFKTATTVTVSWLLKLEVVYMFELLSCTKAPLIKNS